MTIVLIPKIIHFTYRLGILVCCVYTTPKSVQNHENIVWLSMSKRSIHFEHSFSVSQNDFFLVLFPLFCCQLLISPLVSLRPPLKFLIEQRLYLFFIPPLRLNGIFSSTFNVSGSGLFSLRAVYV